MSSVSLCFNVHIPYQLANASIAGTLTDYIDEKATASIANKIAEQCYLPANAIVKKLIDTLQGRFSLAFSMSGTTLEILQRHRPDVLASFRSLAATGCVDFLAQTHSNSLSSLYSKTTFCREVKQHTELIRHHFNITPTVFKNTELVYNNQLSTLVANLGYKGIVCEGLEKLLQGRPVNQPYRSPATPDVLLLLRNSSLCDDIAFKFDDPHWMHHPLTADKYAGWIHTHGGNCNINLLLDYETFGVHKQAPTGIFEFLEHLPLAILQNGQWNFATPAAIVSAACPGEVYDVPDNISWKDRDMGECVWTHNMMQNNMLKKIYSLESMLYANGDAESLACWQRLQSADHFYCMSETSQTANEAHRLLNPYPSAEAAYKNYLAIITDFEIQLIQRGLEKFRNKRTLSTKDTLY